MKVPPFSRALCRQNSILDLQKGALHFFFKDFTILMHKRHVKIYNKTINTNFRYVSLFPRHPTHLITTRKHLLQIDVFQGVDRAPIMQEFDHLPGQRDAESLGPHIGRTPFFRIFSGNKFLGLQARLYGMSRPNLPLNFSIL